MNENMTWLWLAVGLVPYHVEKRRPSRCERTLTVRALFWTLEVRTRWGRPGSNCRTDWTLRVPLIEHLRDAAWAAVMRLKSSDPPQKPES